MSDLIISGGMLDSPFAMDARIMSTPAIIEKILMKLVGVSLPREETALSISKALTINTPPSMASTMAASHLPASKTTARAPAANKTPSTPRKNFEYYGSYARSLRYLPNTAYEYSTL